MISDPELAKRARPMYTPFSAKTYYILSHGGGSFGSPSFSPRTGLLYITGKNAATSHMVQVAGDKLRAGDYGFTATLSGTDNNTGVTPTETVTAYDPITGEMVWQEVHATKSNIGSGGNFATAGDLVFQGNDEGELIALDARSGKVLFKSSGANAIKGSPMTYEINGKQYVAVVATNKILTFALAN
jgi:glucose dehydrogenase